MISIIFFSISASFGVWCAIAPSWELGAVSLIMAGIGAVLGIVRPKGPDLKQAQIDELHRQIDSIKGQLALYGMSEVER